MKRFLLFGTFDEYGGGMGWQHFMGDFDTADEAKAHADGAGAACYADGSDRQLDEAHVIDTADLPYWEFTRGNGWTLYPDRRDTESMGRH